MENYEEIEEELCEFKSYAKLITDLIVDSYKWKKLAEYSEDDSMIAKYHQIANSLMEMYKAEYDHLMTKYKGE